MPQKAWVAKEHPSATFVCQVWADWGFLGLGCLPRVFPDGCISFFFSFWWLRCLSSLYISLPLVFQWVFYALRATIARLLIRLCGLFWIQATGETKCRRSSARAAATGFYFGLLYGPGLKNNQRSLHRCFHLAGFLFSLAYVLSEASFLFYFIYYLF